MAGMTAPLADRLFAIGTNVGSSGQNTFSYQGRKPSGFRVETPPPMQQQQDDGGGQIGALASMGMALGQAMANPSSAEMPVDQNGNGFGLGGKIAGGDIMAPTYAGDSKPGIMQMLGFNKQQEGIQQPLTLGSATMGGRPSLFNY